MWGGSEARAGRASRRTGPASAPEQGCGARRALHEVISLEFMEVTSTRAKNTSMKVIFSLVVLFQSCGATEYKPGTSESSKGHLKILLVKKKWQHFL